MEKLTLAWIVFGVYMLATTALAIKGMRKTQTLAGFALGNRDMGPLLVGITLAAAVASTATFVINPGLVYAFGLSAFLHLGVAGSLGVTVALILFSKGFRKNASDTLALTLPHWVGARFQHPWMRSYFALLNLALSIAFIVLILKGSALVMQHTLGLSYVVSLLIIVIFVFSYIMLGGTYAHAYTNAIQGAIMVIVALVIIASGWHLFGDGLAAFMQKLSAQDAGLTLVANAQAPLYSSYFEVFVCGFVVAGGLVCQPHILTKALYLKRDSDVNRYLVVALLIGLVFSGLLLTGLYARVLYPDIQSPDAVMPIYITRTFSPLVGVLISVALLAAGMSTLDGILVSSSSIAASDVFLGILGERLLTRYNQGQREQMAFKASRWILFATGVISFLLALNPPKLVGIFAQAGIYGLVAASLVPVTLGIFAPRVHANDVFIAALLGPIVHFALYWSQPQAVFNPAITATWGLVAAFFTVGLLSALRWLMQRRRLAQTSLA